MNLNYHQLVFGSLMLFMGFVIWYFVQLAKVAQIDQHVILTILTHYQITLMIWKAYNFILKFNYQSFFGTTSVRIIFGPKILNF